MKKKNQQKRKPLRRKLNAKVKGIYLFSLTSLLILYASCMSSKKTQDLHKNECDEFLKLNNACVMLKVLSDSIEFNKYFVDPSKEEAFNKGQCFRNVMNRLSSDAALGLNWTCSIAPCMYPSLSFEKSIYKIDLIRLMRANGCQDTANLFVSTKGFFTPQELGMIKTANRFEIKIDTMILYGK